MMMTREGILTACSTEPEKIVQLIQSLFQRNQELEARIQVLEAQGKKNSTNSHLPHSSDWAPVPKSSRTASLRAKTKRLLGGQPEHPGHHLVHLVTI